MAGFRRGVWVLVFGVLLFGFSGLTAYADEKAEVIQGFVEHQSEQHGVKAIPDKRRHQILFIMGAFLLIGIMVTVGLGISMALYGKEVFVAHTVSAGLTAFLAVAHAVAAMVWFFPF